MRIWHLALTIFITAIGLGMARTEVGKAVLSGVLILLMGGVGVMCSIRAIIWTHGIRYPVVRAMSRGGVVVLIVILAISCIVIGDLYYQYLVILVHRRTYG